MNKPDVGVCLMVYVKMVRLLLTYHPGFGPEPFVLHAVETERTGAESVCRRCESC